MSSLVEMKNIIKSYQMGKEEYQALKGIDFELKNGELVAMLGESGAGKSTLANIIGLLDRQTSGEYFLDGEDISKHSDEEISHIRGHKIGFVFQSFFLLPKLTAIQNVALPLLYRNIPFKKAKRQALELLERVGISHVYKHKPNQLSGGQQQRVAIARALIGNPELILADEPTGALDSKTSEEVMNLFIDLNKNEKKTILIITHNKKIADDCQRFVKVIDGRIVHGDNLS